MSGGSESDSSNLISSRLSLYKKMSECKALLDQHLPSSPETPSLLPLAQGHFLVHEPVALQNNATSNPDGRTIPAYYFERQVKNHSHGLTSTITNKISSTLLDKSVTEDLEIAPPVSGIAPKPSMPNCKPSSSISEQPSFKDGTLLLYLIKMAPCKLFLDLHTRYPSTTTPKTDYPLMTGRITFDETQNEGKTNIVVENVKQNNIRIPINGVPSGSSSPSKPIIDPNEMD